MEVPQARGASLSGANGSSRNVASYHHRGDGAGRSAQRACERSSDWPRGAEPPAPYQHPTTNLPERAEPPAPEQHTSTNLPARAEPPAPEALNYTNVIKTALVRKFC